jgi:YYY domain-containing protein
MTQEESLPTTTKPRRSLRPWIYDLLLVYILLIGVFFRFVGIYWGEYQYLHPDERFLVWVGSDIQPPSTSNETLGPPPSVATSPWRAQFPEEFPDCESWGGYFDTSCSPLNPNNRGHGFYVYGTLPMFLTRYVVQWVHGHSGFEQMTNVGRPLSALADLASVYLVYLIAARVYNRRVAVLAAALSAFAVLQIQQSHFFTMDTFTNFFTVLAVYFAVSVGYKVKAWRSKVDNLAFDEGEENPESELNAETIPGSTQLSFKDHLLRFIKHPFFLLSIGFGFALGCAVASKLNAAPVAFLLPVAFGLQLVKLQPKERQRYFVDAVLYLIIAAFVSLLVFRIFQPYAFSGPGFFGLKPNPQWVANIVDQRNQAAGDVDFPPAMQWARRPVWFSLQNLVLWGLGLPFGVIAWVGFLWVGWRILKGKWQRHILLWGWTALYFIWQSIQFNPTMRYQLPIYPMLAIYAGWFIVELWKGGSQLKDKPINYRRIVVVIVGAFVMLATFAYAFGFSKIYDRPITRLEASRWIYQNIPGPINLHIETEDGDGAYNQPLSFPYRGEIRAGQPYFSTFQAKASGNLSEVYLAHAVNSQLTRQPEYVTAVVSTSPQGEGPLAQATIEVQPGTDDETQTTEYSLILNQPVPLAKDQIYYVTLTRSTDGEIIDLCNPIVLNITTLTDQVVHVIQPSHGCILQTGIPYSLSFTPQDEGTLSEIQLTQNLYPSPTPIGPMTLTLTLSPTQDEQLVATAQVTSEFDPGEDGRGGGYLFIFDRPVTIEEGKEYHLALALEGEESALMIQSASLANEGDWDDGLPYRVDGYDGFGGIYPPGLNFNMYPDDNQEKLDRFLRIYDQSDYIAISSSRQWGSLPRIPERFPMTSLHYRHLLGCPPEETIEWCYTVAQPGMFQGDFGFELVKVVQSDPNIGPLQINDQFSEEAFTVYDHPKVLIFQKTDDYNPDYVADVMGSVDFSQVIHVTPKKAETYPANLMLPSERLAEQQSGGTWSDLFNSDALYNRFKGLSVVVWYLSVAILGLFVYPLVRLALPGLTDHGYPLARTAGMLSLSFLVWIGGSLRIPTSRLTISGVILLIAIVGAYLAYQQRDDLRQEWHQRRKYILIIEALTLAFFLIFLLIRWGNPDLWHQWKGGEKPMDFSYFNAVLKSTSIPPYDPWYAEGYLNYYYYGFVLVGMLVKWLGIIPSVAYNLIIPTLFSMVAMGAFSVAYNLTAYRKSSADAGDEAQPSVIEPKPIFAGLAAALGMAVLGNLGTVRMILRGYQTVGIPGGLTEDAGFFTRLVGTVRGVFEVLSGATLPYSIGDWYWIPSRVIPAPGEVEPITEFPYFTFIYGDLHAHMIALPVALLALAWIVSVVLARAKWKGILGGAAGFLLGGLAIGALYPINLSDIYTYLPLAIVALAYAIWRYLDVDKLNWPYNLPTNVKRLLVVVGSVVLLVILAYALYMPYRWWYGQAYSSVDLWKGTRTPVSSYLTHWGLFLFVFITWMIYETREWMASTPLSSLRKLESHKGLMIFALALLFSWIGVLLWFGVNIAWLVVPLATWAGVLLLRPGIPDTKRIVLFLIGTSLIITLMVEVIVVRGDIARMNTVFKFYLHTWTLFAVSAGVAISWLVPTLPYWLSRWRIAWQAGLIILLACAAMFPVFGTLAKVNDRMVADAPHSLDGLIYMPYAEYNESGTVMDLSQDYRAIRWMQENIQGSPVIVEANSPNLYRWYSRYTINTGLPGVLGWEWHQQQQRALNPSDWVNKRLAEINQFYLTMDSGYVRDFLRKYNVRYIVVGQLEQATYAGPGLDKFPAFNGVLWRDVYQDGDTVIYEVIDPLVISSH